MIVVVALFLTGWQQGFAEQNIRFQRISEHDGLSQNTVRCILQDSRGFIWLGTINGLNRYNGKEFTVMRPEIGKAVSLSDNRIRSLMEDRFGYIWIRTVDNTYDCYNPTIENFVDYAPAVKRKNFVRAVELPNGDVWLWGGNVGCCRVRHIDKQLQSTCFNEKDFGVSTIYQIMADTNGQVYILTANGVWQIDADGRLEPFCSETFMRIHEFDGQIFLINNRQILTYSLTDRQFGDTISYTVAPDDMHVSAMSKDGIILIETPSDVLVFDARKKHFIASAAVFHEKIPNANFYADNKGNIWIYNLTGAIWRHIADTQFEKITLMPPAVVSLIDAERYEICHDAQDMIWISTYGAGLYAFNAQTGEMDHYTTENSDLPTNYLLSIAEDRSGEIWAGTEFSGVCKISRNNYPVRLFEPAENDAHYRSNSVRMIYQDSRGRFWMGTRSGYLYVYDAALQLLKLHRIAAGLPFCAIEDKNGNIWIGTRGNKLMVFAPSADRIVRSCDIQHTFDLTIDRENRIWVASFGSGLYYADLDHPQLQFVNISLGNASRDMGRVILQDREGWIWLGTNEGVNVFQPDRLIADPQAYINFHFDINDSHSLNNNEVKAIYEDSQGRLWLGTTGGGLNLLVREDPLSQSWFKHYTAKNGLSNEVVQSICEDREGNLWLTTEGETGISKFNPTTELFENFNFTGGKQSNLFNESAGWQTDDGKLMFGSSAGVYVFEPESIKYDAYAPPVVITGLKINGADVRPLENRSPLVESISLTKTIRLPYGQNSFNIEFAMLNFQSPDFNQYAYYLEGYEKEWNPISRYNVAAYRNLPAGDYRFRVKGSNAFGVWTTQDTCLEITILPPFWKSAWAYLIYLLIGAGGIWFAVGIILHINRLNLAVKVEKQLTDYKLRFFTNISHEFRTPLTIIRGTIENLTAFDNLPPEHAKSIRLLNKSSNRLLRLIDQLLDFRKLQNKGLELKVERTEAVSFFYDIFLVFREVAEKKNIRLLFEHNLPRYDMLLDRNKFDKITYNLLSNALKHTPEGGVILMKIHFSEVNNRMTLSVADSGAGVPKDRQNALFVRFAQIDDRIGGTGVGLHLTAEMAAVHKGTVEYSDAETGGACFSVSVPLADANYSPDEIVRSQPLATKSPEMITVDGRFKNYRILVIEDEDDVREFIVGQLEKYFSIIAAKNGREGLETAIAVQPNLIVCDVMMPEMDGFEFTRRLKTDFQSSHIPVILLTAHSSEEDRLEGIQAGADSYITKPFSVQYLLTRIVNLIENRETLRQKFAQEPRQSLPMNAFTDKDADFLRKADAVIERQLENIHFSVDDFAQTMKMGRTTFYKKIKGLTGYTPNDYMMILRMKRAADLLNTTDLNISEVAYKVGFDDRLYFSKCFKKQFGVPPKAYKKSG